MSSLAGQVLILVLLLVINGLFALAEIAVVSVRKARLQQRADRGDLRAEAALRIARSPDEFLSTVQIGITLIGILIGAFSGANFSEILARRLAAVPGLAPYSGSLALGIVVLATTYLSLVIGELVPKRLALNNPEGIAMAAAVPMGVLSRLTYPAVWVLTVSTAAVVRLLRIQPASEPAVTEEEVRSLLRQGAEAGVFELGEQQMVDRVFRLGDRRIGALMTPRREVVWLDINDAPELICRKLAESRHSRFPVCEGSPDRISGTVHATDLLLRVLRGEPPDLRASAQPALFVPESTRAAKVLELFRQSGRHFALVLDEHGGTQGLITATDILEAIVGEIPVTGEDTDRDVVRREDGSWLLDGRLPVDELREQFRLRELPEEESGDYETLAGMVVTCLGRIPAAGEYFVWEGLRFEVVDMDGLRVDKVLVSREEIR